MQPQVSGPIVRIAFTEGQDVQKGQVLFEIDPRPFQAALAQAAAANKTICVIFYSDWNADAAAMAQVVKAHAEKNATKATWTTVRISDPADKATVDRFQVSRAPMPLVLSVHPNGAVTGASVKKATEAALAPKSPPGQARLPRSETVFAERLP